MRKGEIKEVLRNGEYTENYEQAEIIDRGREVFLTALERIEKINEHVDKIGHNLKVEADEVFGPSEKECPEPTGPLHEGHADRLEAMLDLLDNRLNWLSDQAYRFRDL